MGVDARVFATKDVEGYERIEYHSMQRWFSDNYPRGHWPTLREQIVFMQEKFPDYDIYYSNDNYWDTEPSHIVTPERLAELDAAWEEYGWD